MIRLAVIGTNWITDQFIEAALLTGSYRLSGVYSRNTESAKQFSEKYVSPEIFTDLDALAQSALIDAVYIASPNSFHAPQAEQLLKAGKHVICEKPLASNYQLAKQLYQTARDNNVILFEAFMTPHLPNFTVLKQELNQIGALRKATISYCQFSSRYPKYLNGENPNTFNPEFSNGSIMDIGYYCVGAAIALFGEPISIKAQAHLLDSGVDGNGSAIFQYSGFDVVINHSKTSDSYLPSEFQGEEAALQVEMISLCNRVEKITRGPTKQDVSVEQVPNRMFYEAKAFAKQVEENTMDEHDIERSLIVSKVLTEIRKQTGVVFPTDAVPTDV
ncbi:Gfo/Idh/MocA family oxidoreductase [Vibrio sp. ZSDE26]|uniref:Gfo/Idh/MocA family oxidoreductase n=1 Tax=Vibrio amylolyticus TaxID=2847292 RepID=A0A9X1XNF9_9VIBR|nr:Gfo/Idh/MocA family oxidoreductase [Vibrio amylolyticus]MCK6265665.1 Gfo/Idh/MocA family oxidoreductase [Vibrio amylolyticus]